MCRSTSHRPVFRTAAPAPAAVSAKTRERPLLAYVTIETNKDLDGSDISTAASTVSECTMPSCRSEVTSRVDTIVSNVREGLQEERQRARQRIQRIRHQRSRREQDCASSTSSNSIPRNSNRSESGKRQRRLSKKSKEQETLTLKQDKVLTWSCEILLDKLHSLEDQLELKSEQCITLTQEIELLRVENKKLHELNQRQALLLQAHKQKGKVEEPSLSQLVQRQKPLVRRQESFGTGTGHVSLILSSSWTSSSYKQVVLYNFHLAVEHSVNIQSVLPLPIYIPISMQTQQTPKEQESAAAEQQQQDVIGRDGSILQSTFSGWLRATTTLLPAISTGLFQNTWTASRISGVSSGAFLRR